MQIVIDKENLITMFAMVLYVISGKPEYDDAINVVTELLEKIGYTPLPKGHGRLIDESDLMPDSDYEDGIFYAVSIGAINGAPTIIEADKGADNGADNG